MAHLRDCPHLPGARVRRGHGGARGGVHNRAALRPPVHGRNAEIERATPLPALQVAPGVSDFARGREFFFRPRGNLAWDPRNFGVVPRNFGVVPRNFVVVPRKA